MIHAVRGYLDLQVNRSPAGQSPMMTDRSRFLASMSSSSALISLEQARDGVTKGSRAPDPFQRGRNALIGHFTARMIR